jgi:hypothetical protein
MMMMYILKTDCGSRGLVMKLFTNFHLALRLRISGAVPSPVQSVYPVVVPY